jgi:prepilin-type N-terminal cleavage/methylation domain-containing protein
MHTIIYQQTPHARNRSGFSLVEVMLALGIMAVGLTMAMAIFPVAVKENETSFDDVISSIMLENALAMAPNLLSLGDANNAAEEGGLLLGDATDYVSDETQLYYPSGLDSDELENKARGRMRIFAKKSSTTSITMVITAYRGSTAPMPDKCEGVINDKNLFSPSSTNVEYEVGGWLINRTSGIYAQIVKAEEDTLTLDRNLVNSLNPEPWYYTNDIIGIRRATITPTKDVEEGLGLGAG